MVCGRGEEGGLSVFVFKRSNRVRKKECGRVSIAIPIGHLTIASSTTSGSGVMKSEEKISGLKNTSGPRNLSYPTSHRYGNPVDFYKGLL